MTPRYQVLETFRRVLRQTTLRAIVRPQGRTPDELTQEEAAALLEPYEQALGADFSMCVEIADQLLALAENGKDVEAQIEEATTLVLDSEE